MATSQNQKGEMMPNVSSKDMAVDIGKLRKLLSVPDHMTAEEAYKKGYRSSDWVAEQVGISRSSASRRLVESGTDTVKVKTTRAFATWYKV
jgi:hypothetical protein